MNNRLEFQSKNVFIQNLPIVFNAVGRFFYDVLPGTVM